MNDDLSEIPLHQSPYECDIVEATSAVHMAKLLNELLWHGWQLKGGICSYQAHSGAVIYVQLVIRHRRNPQ